ncbi:MAG: hypothetical protein LBH66_04575 [Oscillospiraceae bacterium]|jgi:predicted outer membrane repeat protein|nr:hypothetical protein [Oscillospiraceae bacterium]
MQETSARCRIVGDEARLREAVEAGGEILLEKNIGLTETLIISRDAVLSAFTVLREDGTPSKCALYRDGAAGDMIRVSEGARLAIKHITIDGGGIAGVSAIIDVAEGAALEVLTGAALVNSHDKTVCADSPALRVRGACVVDGGLFRDNYSNMGGAVHNAGALTIKDALFSQNGSCGDGGAIANEGVCVIERAMFKDNGADGSGGAIYSAEGASLEFARDTDNIEFDGNRAAAEGWDIYAAGADGAGGLALGCLEASERLRPGLREIVNIDPVAKLTYGSAYLPEEFTVYLYGPNGSLVSGPIPLNPDGYFYIPPFDVDTSVIGSQVYTLYEPQTECGRWRADWSAINYTFVTDGTVIISRSADRPSEFRNRFIYPQRCREPESYCALNIQPTDDCPCRVEPVPLVENESIFLPVVRKWNW